MSTDIQPASSNLPQQKQGMPDWGAEYLKALQKAEGALVKAARMIGINYPTTYKGRLRYPDLDKAVIEIKAEWDSKHLAMLEEVSLTQALKPGCFPERAFRMKAHDDRYKDKHISGPGSINIILGFSIGGNGRPKTLEISPAGREITDAEVEEESPKPKKGRRASIDVLTEDELDV